MSAPSSEIDPTILLSELINYILILPDIHALKLMDLLDLGGHILLSLRQHSNNHNSHSTFLEFEGSHLPFRVCVTPTIAANETLGPDSRLPLPADGLKHWTAQPPRAGYPAVPLHQLNFFSLTCLQSIQRLLLPISPQDRQELSQDISRTDLHNVVLPDYHRCRSLHRPTRPFSHSQAVACARPRTVRNTRWRLQQCSYDHHSPK